MVLSGFRGIRVLGSGWVVSRRLTVGVREAPTDLRGFGSAQTPDSETSGRRTTRREVRRGDRDSPRGPLRRRWGLVSGVRQGVGNDGVVRAVITN